SDPTPPRPADLAQAAGGRPVYAAQASLHSAICTPELLAAAEGKTGYHPSGWVRQDAHHTVRSAALASLSPQRRQELQRRALRRAAALGIAAVHECGGPQISSEADFTSALALSGDGLPEVY